jgi:hypothetical protein
MDMDKRMSQMQENMKMMSGMGDPHGGPYPGMIGGPDGPMPE